MAHSLSAKKRVRQNVKRRAVNRWRKDKVRTAVKTYRACLIAGELDKAEAQLKALYKLLDKVGFTSTMSRNTASRYKSRLTLALNKARSAKSQPAAA